MELWTSFDSMVIISTGKNFLRRVLSIVGSYAAALVNLPNANLFENLCCRFRKGDHDGAIQQYIKTIGKLEASYVIRKVSNFVSAMCA